MAVLLLLPAAAVGLARPGDGSGPPRLWTGAPADWRLFAVVSAGGSPRSPGWWLGEDRRRPGTLSRRYLDRISGGRR